jgi:Holliday junction resolvase
MTMGRTSREKGKRGERELAQALRDLGIDARRSVQYSGREGTADLTTSLPGVHWEAKRSARIAALRFLEQAERDSPATDLPVVACREDRGPWTVIVRLEDLPRLAEKIAEHLET